MKVEFLREHDFSSSEYFDMSSKEVEVFKNFTKQSKWEVRLTDAINSIIFEAATDTGRNPESKSKLSRILNDIGKFLGFKKYELVDANNKEIINKIKNALPKNIYLVLRTIYPVKHLTDLNFRI